MHGRTPILLLAAVVLAIAGWLADRSYLPALLLLPPLSLLLLLLPVRRPEAGDAPAAAAVADAPGPGADRISLAALDDPALIVSAAWRVLAANQGAEKLFARRLLQRDLRQTVRHPLVLDSVRAALQGEDLPHREVASPGAHGGGLFRLRLVRLDGGRVLLHFLDIGEARAAEQTRVDFVANASHELRTPLTSITGFIETLQGPAATDAPARKRFLAIMAQEAARMRRLIDDLLSLSRIEMDRHLRPTGVLELPPLLHEVADTVAPRLAADGRELLLEVDAGLPPVLADRDQILQVLHNLLTNAQKYGRPGTPIRLAATAGPLVRGEATVRLLVQDQGEGIAAEHLPRLTERFYRVDAGRSRDLGGTGLGLAIVKHIIERHRGRLDIDSRVGEGTAVSLLLPVAPS